MNPAIEELQQLDQWVAHDLNKIPFGPDGKPASSTDSSTWMSFEQARALQRSMRLAGVGFVMSTHDDLIGIDLDKALDPEGNVKPWAEAIVNQLNSYTEVSPSGTGLHIWVRGKLPAGGRQKRIEDGRLEVYEKARYFTVTGRHVLATPDEIAVWGGTIGEWYWLHFEEPTPEVPLFVDVDEDLDSELEAALEHIDAGEYHTWVVVGFALKSHFGDAGFELWRRWSATASNYCGDDKAWRKWRSFGKKDGVTYRTILHFAMENGFTVTPKYLEAEDIFPGIHSFCESILRGEEPWEPEEDAEAPWEPETDEKPTTAFAFDASDLRASETHREYLIGPRIAGLGDVIVMAGPPKSMKSFVTLDMLAHFACGEAWKGIAPAKPLRTLLLNCELHIEAVAERLQLLGKAPPPGTLFITDRIRSGITKDMVERMQAHVTEHGPFDVLVIDPIANLFTEDNENDNKAMMTFLGHLKQLRDITLSEDAILWLVHHARKASLRDLEADPFNAFRGASSLRGFYDSGIAVWRAKDNQIGVDFELRNGEGLDRLKLEFSRGIFEVADTEEDDEETKSDRDIMESVLCSWVFATQKEAAQACADQEARVKGEAKDLRTWQRRVSAAVKSGLIVKSEEGWTWTESQ